MINIFMISILLIGTCDTKADEIHFLKSCIESEAARALVMDELSAIRRSSPIIRTTT
jgi:uncharacterized protein (UPF0261 family)